MLASWLFKRPIVTCDEPALHAPNLVFLGSIAHWADAHSQVCGAGLVSGALRPQQPPAAVHAVRGPLTATVFREAGINCPPVFGDPGVLVRRFFPVGRKPDIPVGVVPHYVDVTHPWLELCRERGWHILDVSAPVETFLAGLQRCEVVLSSCLHGIVFAHAYGRRALWIELSSRVHGDGFKFLDYYASLGVSAERVDRCRIDAGTPPSALPARARAADTSALERALIMAVAASARALEIP